MPERTLSQALEHAALAATKDEDNFRHPHDFEPDADPDPCCCWCALIDIQILAEEVRRLQAEKLKVQG